MNMTKERLFLAGTAVRDLPRLNLAHAGFAAVNLAFFVRGFGAFLGWRETWVDAQAAARPSCRPRGSMSASASAPVKAVEAVAPSPKAA